MRLLIQTLAKLANVCLRPPDEELLGPCPHLFGLPQCSARNVVPEVYQGRRYPTEMAVV
jgi:hypothetical protein